ncbi:hypothetical protein COS91_06625 [Candidatus Desantisbacteria bacterium CG07_land_8_20_14_0_80_39_15]|uniref:Uncharacterized protein n=1 Tax=Candidatus Desantisbacteria bacterium CG07_land_8_20_14_0_80_39_15 TaxID=1974549 RepID=A0A2M6ZF75_9BACT|nr:MAG: hypothetical protein COS91_06625 [Candidatus Desantisbacteria bacterium CG07_land_8_20_14_0_80_39_15]
MKLKIKNRYTGNQIEQAGYAIEAIIDSEREYVLVNVKTGKSVYKVLDIGNDNYSVLEKLPKNFKGIAYRIQEAM